MSAPSQLVPTLGELQEPSYELLRRLELVITKRLNGLLRGDHRGLTPAHGSEPGEARPYLFGDDVRRIDWNVTARMQDTYLRETIADRELDTWILIDYSPSIGYGTALCEKRDLVLAACAAIGFLAAGEGNRIGALIATPEGNRIFPARGGRAHLFALLDAVMTTRPPASGSIELDAAIGRLGGLARRRGLCAVVSDFLAEPGWLRSLRQITTRHDVLAVEVLDPREMELPNVGVLGLVDPESGEFREVQTSSAKLRHNYAEAAQRQRDTVDEELRRSGADHLLLRTDRDWFHDLVRFVLRRRQVASHSSGSRGGR
ncbi:MAG: DUF58 domain-containing protein [Candidatus Dormibacteria bacterium]